MPKPRLFHASEEPSIESFTPRPPPNPEAGVVGDAVWAIDETHLPNYLLPRDCPRVTFTASESTSPMDHERFLGGQASRRVIALEEIWRPKIESCQLYLYEFATDDFELIDANAGYYISRVTAKPIAVTKMTNLVSELLARNVDVRFLPNLWDLRNAVGASTLEFSIIRFRNAQAKI